jgi:3'-phosphoadenosine 5'-phosphosulfate sulfotransferase (PAPS reductase)/FAD synthetase
MKKTPSQSQVKLQQKNQEKSQVKSQKKSKSKEKPTKLIIKTFMTGSAYPTSFGDLKLHLNNYDKFVVAFSGGKDSLASVLYLLECGVPKSKIELWHHCVDGREGSSLMDWPVTEDYCKAVAKALDLPLFFSWKVNGFEGEMLRNNARTAPTRFEIPADNPEEDNLIECGKEVRQAGGDGGKLGTRRKFPQVAMDLRTRWCSAYLKIGVCTAAINNQDRFNNSRTLTISGERAEESSGRANYKEVEPDPADNRDGKKARYVDRARPIHKWSEAEVWAIIERHKINPHPAYRLGWGRLSCMCCIFGNANQWASVKAVAPEKFTKIAEYEKEFGFTIHRTKSVKDLAAKGESYEFDKDLATKSQTPEYKEPAVVEDWSLPLGAFGESTGPT